MLEYCILIKFIMKFKNNINSYGAISLALHWKMATLIYGLFFLGLYMVELDYVDEYYTLAPDMHRGFGFILFALLIFRIGWNLYSNLPEHLPMDKFQTFVSKLVHKSFYVLIALVCISGYLISTAGGRGTDFFGLFQVPATLYGYKGQEDIAGKVHFYLAFFMVLLSGLHIGASLKHHFIDKDKTLKRILGIDDSNSGTKL